MLDIISIAVDLLVANFFWYGYLQLILHLIATVTHLKLKFNIV